MSETHAFAFGGVSLWGAAVAGASAGGLHAVSGPDHLAALLPLCMGSNLWAASRVGGAWGASTVYLIKTFVIFPLFSLKVHVPGLTGKVGTLSFESKSKPGFFLRHFEFESVFESNLNPRNADIYREDATFKIHRDLFAQV